MLKLTDEQLKDIAGDLDCGMKSYVHKNTGEYFSIPTDVLLGNTDEDAWEDDLEKLQKDENNYIEIERPDSRKSFQIMEDFVYTLKDEHFSKRLVYALSRPKPFQNFKHEIDYSSYRQDWFDFKLQRTIALIKQQILESTSENR